MSLVDVLSAYGLALLNGLFVNFLILLASMCVGTFGAVFVEIMCHAIGCIFRKLVDWIALFFASTPSLVVLFWLFYPGQAIISQNISPLNTAIAALSIINMFACYRIVSASIRDFPRQYITVARVCGLSDTALLWSIYLPLVARNALPRWLDQQVVILQTSLFASLISVDEVFRVAQRVNSVIYRPVLIYTSMAFVFALTAGSLLLIAERLRVRFDRDYSER